MAWTRVVTTLSLVRLLTAAGCASDETALQDDVAETTDVSARADVAPHADLPASTCEFEEVTVGGVPEPISCSGRTEDQCEAEGCSAVYGHLVTRCTTDSDVDCSAEPTFLGCGQFSVCKEESFLCSQDLRSAYATGRRCIPPTGWVPCFPSGQTSDTFQAPALGQCG
ncbi:MAG: hypothetical protein ACRBN8_14670 [Nannocystales bacterium]